VRGLSNGTTAPHICYVSLQQNQGCCTAALIEGIISKQLLRCAAAAVVGWVHGD